MKTLKRYIPEKVYEKLQQLEYSNKEHLYVICDMIYRISIYRKDDSEYQYTDIPRVYLSNIITNSNYLSDAINFLLNNNIIETDNIYSKESKKSKGYRFKKEYISKLTSVEIETLTIKRNIINNKNDRNNVVSSRYKKYKKHFMDTFKIDYNKALNLLDNEYNKSMEYLNNPNNYNTTISTLFLCSTNVSLTQAGQDLTSDSFLENWIKITNKYNKLFMSISAINDGNLFFRKNKTNGRIDNNLTNLKKDFKQFIIKPNLNQIDIKNSQPYILSLLINSFLCERNVSLTQAGQDLTSDSFLKELDKYSLWTSTGKFYENFSNQYFMKTSKVLTRKEIKDLMFCIFYSKNNTYIKEKNIFKSIFPNIMKYINEQKKKNHNQFAIKMQKLESEICIDIICPKLDEKGIEYYTIHDAWLVDKKDLEETKNIILESFKEKYNSIPTLDFEKIN